MLIFPCKFPLVFTLWVRSRLLTQTSSYVVYGRKPEVEAPSKDAPAEA